MSKIKISAVVLFSLCTLTLSAKDYKASMFGVKSDGITLNSRSIQKAVDFINENGGGRLVFYVDCLAGTIQLKSNVTIQLEEGAVLVGTASVYDYSGKNDTKALISADSLENIGITGKGVIEGQGAAVLDNIRIEVQKGYLKGTVALAGPILIFMNNCCNVNIEQISLVNSCGNVQSYTGCRNLNIREITVKSNVVAGSKGIVLSGCDGVKMTDLFFDTSGDELIMDRTSTNVSAVNCKNAKGKKTTYIRVKNIK